MNKDEIRLRAFNSQPAKYRKGAVMSNTTKRASKEPVKPNVSKENK